MRLDRHRRLGVHRAQRAAARAARLGDRGGGAPDARARGVRRRSISLTHVRVGALRSDATRTAVARAARPWSAAPTRRCISPPTAIRRCRPSGRAWDLESNTVALVTFLEHCPVDHVVYRVVRRGLRRHRRSGVAGDAVSPRLPYAISKLASEQYVRFFAERRHTVGQLHQRPLLRRLRAVRAGRGRSRRAGCRRWPPASASSRCAATART